MKNKISDLRDHLFATIEELRDKENPMDVHRAQAIAEVARAAIDSAKVEVAMLRVLDDMGAQDVSTTGFIPVEAEGERVGESQRQLLNPSSEHPWRRSWGKPRNGSS